MTMQLTCKADVEKMESIVRELGGNVEANPNYDRESELNQEHQDLTEKIFNESIRPNNITGEVIYEAIRWAKDNMDSSLESLAEKLETASAGQRLQEIVFGYLWEQAQKEANKS